VDRRCRPTRMKLVRLLSARNVVGNGCRNRVLHGKSPDAPKKMLATTAKVQHGQSPCLHRSEWRWVKAASTALKDRLESRAQEKSMKDPSSLETCWSIYVGHFQNQGPPGVLFLGRIKMPMMFSRHSRPGRIPLRGSARFSAHRKRYRIPSLNN
jgi:hypothetical protein